MNQEFSSIPRTGGKNTGPQTRSRTKAQLAGRQNALLEEIKQLRSQQRKKGVPRQRSSNLRPSLVGSSAFSAAPVSQTRVVKTGRPKMTSLPNGDARIIHREYIGEVTAGTSSPSVFSNTSYPVNPGQNQTFPWLSQIASRYESYRFNALRFDYETEAPSSLGGSLVLALDYDASDPAPVSKQQALAFRESVRSAPWKECRHVSLSEDLNKQKSYFVRNGSQPSTTDIKTYDVGNLNVITQGVTTASSTCGELYVEYDVTLMTPVYENVALGGASAYVPSATTAAPFASAQFGGGLGLSASGTTLTCTGLLPGAEYYFGFSSTSSASSSASFGTFTGTTGEKSTLNVYNEAVGMTFVATSSTVSFVVTLSANASGSLYILQQIPTYTI